MRVTVFDRHPGAGLTQWLLMASWAAGCWLQKLLGLVDDYHGATSWDDAIGWLASRPAPLSSVQYWGHGSPGLVWLAGTFATVDTFKPLKPKLDSASTVWFRTCSTFQGVNGQRFAVILADTLNCTVAAHTRVIGLWQGGLHTHKPQMIPSWPLEEAEYRGTLPAHLFPVGNNVIFCMTTRIPEGW